MASGLRPQARPKRPARNPPTPAPDENFGLVDTLRGETHTLTAMKTRAG